MAFIRRHTNSLRFFQALMDGLCVLAGAAVASYETMPPGGYETFRAHFISHLPYFIVFVVVWSAAATEQRLFVSRRDDSLVDQIWSIVRAVALTLVFSGFIVVFFTNRQFEQLYLFWFGGATLFFLILVRGIVRVSLWHIRSRGMNWRHILIVGANDRAAHLVDIIREHGQYGYHIAGFLDDEPERASFFEDREVPWLGELDDLEKVMLSQVVDEVYVCLPVRTYYEKITQMAHLCEGNGTPTRLIADLFALNIANRRVQQFEDIPLLSLSTVPEAQLQLFLKRALDLGVSSLFMVLVAWWLFPIVAICIKLESKGPVFFKQERVGLNQRRFKMIKFRSMVVDAEKLKEKLLEQNEADGPVFKMKHDPRMTRVGRFIRKFSIDELPQFFNVFVGHMSLVGPRPPVPAEVEDYSWDQRRRLSVRPGITGLQQVSGRSDLSFDEWIDLDLAYIDHWSFQEDIRILIRTFEVVVLARGAA